MREEDVGDQADKDRFQEVDDVAAAQADGPGEHSVGVAGRKEPCVRKRERRSKDVG